MWTLDKALPLIRELQPAVTELGYHIVLGGGVLNRGTSEKDLDLFFLRLNGEEGEKDRLFDLLNATFGPLKSIRDSPDYHGNDLWHYRDMQMGTYLGLRVDLFIQ